MVQEDWKKDLASGKIERETHVRMIIDKLRQVINELPMRNTLYCRLLDFMATRSINGTHHRLMTTNWDYLLQRDLDNWIQANYAGLAPRFLSTHGTVYHFNGSAEPGEFQNRSPFILETDSASVRKATYEANQAFKHLLCSNLVVIVGMSFECQTDRGLLAALRAHEDYAPVGSAYFVIVDPDPETLESTCAKIATCFPSASGVRVNCGFTEWIDRGMPELIGRIFT